MELYLYLNRAFEKMCIHEGIDPSCIFPAESRLHPASHFSGDLSLNGGFKAMNPWGQSGAPMASTLFNLIDNGTHGFYTNKRKTEEMVKNIHSCFHPMPYNRDPLGLNTLKSLPRARHRHFSITSYTYMATGHIPRAQLFSANTVVSTRII
jgi:hypothetical protein